MDTNNSTVSVVRNKALVTPRRIIRVASLFCIIFVFCPAFFVSCSGQEIEVDVMTAVSGMSMYGENVVEPHPIMLICLFIPIAVLGVLFLKKMEEKKVAFCSLICMVVDFIVWFIFKSTVKKIAEENYCTFEITGWFYANMISMSLIIIFALLVIIRIIQMDTDLIKLLTDNSKQETLSQMSDAIAKMTSTINKLATSVAVSGRNEKMNEDRIGFCMKCGASILYGCKFCTSCGTEVPSMIIEEAKNKRKDDRALFCHQCGSRLESDPIFCEQCGTKVE